MKRLLRGASALVLVGLIAGFGYERWSRWAAARSYPPTGSVIDVGGGRWHLHCSGEGAPTVVLEAGLDVAGSQSWSTIYPDLVEGGRVCSYDRAGIMWSDDRETTRDAANITDELHALLRAASESPPYVMVGHSLGGPLARVFDHRFPGEVVGFVFVDSSHPEQDERLPPEIAEAGRVSPLLLRTLSAIGVLRLTSSSMSDALPEHAAAAVSAFVPESMSGAIAEIAAVDAVLEQARATGTLAGRPIVVLTAARPIDPLPSGVDRATADRMREVWGELQAEIAALSTNSDHRVLPHASHYIHWDDPDAVVAAVRDVVQAVRAEAQ